jgi:uncharacterized protein
MFFVKVSLNKSTIHGIGLFANQSIEQGTVIYKSDEDLDLLISPSELSRMDEQRQNTIKHYGYFDREKGKWHLAYDDIRFCNHSKSPNIGLKGGCLVALRDISDGEELSQDYSDFEELRKELR